MPVRWRVYYADGSTFDDGQGGPEEAPPTGVICVKERNRMHGWVVRSGKDYYIWNIEADEWWPADAPGFWQYMFLPGWKAVLFGVSTIDERFHEIMARANTDEGFGEKSALSPLEEV